VNIIRLIKNNLFRICLAVLFVLSPCLSYSQEKIYGLLYTDMMPVEITIRDGLIRNVKRMNKLPKGSQPLIIAPGFIDNQINGFAGVSFSVGNSELTAEGIRNATYAIWRTGVTTFLPNINTNDRELIKRNIVALAHMKDEPALLGSIPGIHLEGPYISPVDGFRGSHPLKYIRKPDWEEFQDLYELSERSILQITLAPELVGAMEFIDKCKSNGIIVGLGHHNASSEIISEAVARGARIVTSIGSGLANFIDKSDNPLWPQLSDDRLLISLVCDKFSLPPEELRVFYKVKGPSRIIIASDVTKYASLQPGKFVTDNGDSVELTSEGRLIYAGQNIVYGSASPIKDGVANLMNLTGCSLSDAVMMASTNPAKLYGFSDRGSIAVGKRADIILFRLVGSEIVISKTYVKGNLVFNATPDSR
jgi:N-acetylglucosamine-6-phosphate deacetylase